jgi:outer membrane receptor protein involved in Fe transport
LVNEEAEAHTVGFVLQPHWLLKNLSIGADYFKIDLNGSIETVTATQLIQSCFDNPAFAPLSPDCTAVVRLPNFQITTFTTGFRNVGFRKFEGGTLSADYRLPLEDIDLAALGDDIAFSVNWFHLDTLETSTNGLPSGLTVLDGEWGDSHDEVALNVNYRNGRFAALMNWQWQSAALWDAQGSSEFRNILGPDSYSITNLSLSYDVTEQVRARFIVNNLFDVAPPDGTTGADAIGIYDVFGRRFAVGLQGHF